MRRWLEDRDEFLHELIRLDGRADHDRQVPCRCCESEVPTLRCNDCHGGELFCSECVVYVHATNPFHHIEV